MGLCLRRHVTIAAASLVAGVYAATVPFAFAWAQEWRVTPDLSVIGTFSDNINNATEGSEKSDFVLTTSPGVSVTGSGGRISLSASYSPSYLHYFQGNGDSEFRHNLLGRSSVELIEQAVFVNAQASINQQFIDSSAGISQSPDFTSSSNQTQVTTFNINPEFRHHFGTWAESVTSYNFSFTHTDSDAITSTDSQSASFVLNSGDRFTNFSWSLSATRSKSGSSNEQSTYQADAEYPFSRKFSVLGGVGMETFDDSTLNDNPDGLIWNVGVRLTPGPRTSFEANYNERYDDQFISFQGDHKFGASTNVSVSYSTTLTNSQQLLGSQLASTQTGEGGVIIDPATGQPFLAGDSAFGLTDNTFKQQRFQASISSSRRRNTYGADAFLETRETDATGSDETVFGGSLRYSRTHTRKANSSLSLTYQNSDFGTADGREDDYFTASASFNYRIFTDFNGSVSYNFSKRSSSVESNDLMSNSLTVSLQKTF
jgi:uncharacterized protein (PEP-CTERM system associated)